jgi:hypothetical protein
MPRKFVEKNQTYDKKVICVGDGAAVPKPVNWDPTNNNKINPYQKP